MFKHLAVAVAAAALVPSLALADSWEAEASHTNASFKVRHLMVSWVRGEFPNAVKANLDYDPKNPASLKVEATIETKTIDTRNEKRDEHLRSPDFFDSAAHPEMKFKSTKTTANKDGSLSVAGDLTIRGTTKPVTLAVEKPVVTKNPWGQTVLGTTATTKINRKEFGLAWNKALESGGMLVGEDVEITLDLEFQPKAPAAAATK